MVTIFTNALLSTDHHTKALAFQGRWRFRHSGVSQVDFKITQESFGIGGLGAEGMRAAGGMFWFATLHIASFGLDL